MTRSEALQVLGLSGDASDDEVALAYRELAQMLHPDKFGENKRLRARAEQQMRRINEARDVLLKGRRGNGVPRGSGAPRRAKASVATDPARIRFEAEARARAAEVARLTVVAQARTMRERRRSMTAMALVAAVVTIVCSRMRSSVGMLACSVASMLVVWGIVDVVSLSGQISTLRRRSADLARQRDAAARIAEEASLL